jgi:NTE family protein
MNDSGDNRRALPAARGRKNRPLALVLQGGGALGAFQAGAYQALVEQELRPFWIAGTSIGAINAAIIAGNPPEHALERLDEFWTLVSTPDPGAPPDSLIALRRAYNYWSAQQAALTGQPGFFTPRVVPWITMPPGTPPATSYYDTTPLHATLERLVDFDRINARETRLSLGAVEVTTGETVYFDNRVCRIGPEHVMASGALPPGFPAIEIDGKAYWDGGIVSNTPLDVILRMPPPEDLLCFVVDLWDPRGPIPANLLEVEGRVKNITFASRTRQHVDLLRKINQLRSVIHVLYEKIPERALDEETRQQVRTMECPHLIDILHLVYEEAAFEISSMDYEFSRSSVARHRTQGYEQAKRILLERGWCAPSPVRAEVRLHESPHLPKAMALPGNGREKGRPRRNKSKQGVAP